MKKIIPHSDTVGTIPNSKKKKIEAKEANWIPLTFLAWYKHCNKKRGQCTNKNI